MEKYAVRFILNGKSRTYILNDVGTSDAICTAIDYLEGDVPGIGTARGIAVMVKPYPEGAYLADEGEGPVIDTTRQPLRLVSEHDTVLEAA